MICTSSFNFTLLIQLWLLPIVLNVTQEHYKIALPCFWVSNCDFSLHLLNFTEQNIRAIASWLLSSSHFKQLSLMQFQLIEDIFLLVDEMHPIFFIQGLGHMMYHKAACVENVFFGSFSHESIMLHLLIHSANFCSQNN